MSTEVEMKTGRPEFDNFYPTVKSFLEKDTLDVAIDGEKIRGYRPPDAKSIWIRDYSDMMRGFKYFETDLTSVVDHFAETQSASGRIFDYFTTFPEKPPSERENWVKYVRVPVEADVEFRFVKAAYLAWQATGDDEWIQVLLPRMMKALNYIITHKYYWDKVHNLIKRPYTIDTWDFAYTAGTHDWLQFQIDENTFWGFMHGDNSGYYEAFRIMEKLSLYLNRPRKAALWAKLAEKVRSAMNRVCWNGNFYTHFVKLSSVSIEGVDETKQLSLSNPMDINRGAATHEMAVFIIKEYLKRRKQTEAFAEWFSIDPPFPDGIFGDEKIISGAYCNGGIMPLVGGELAKAALDHGFEEYGVDILERYCRMISESGETYLWYFPDKTPPTIETSTSPEAQPTDGWGSSAMLYGFIEGLAGVEDRLCCFRKTKLSPRWLAAGIDDAEVKVGCKASDSGVGYGYKLKDDKLTLEVEATNESDVLFQVLIPADRKIKNVKAGRVELEYKKRKIENSRYIDFKIKKCNNRKIAISFK